MESRIQQIINHPKLIQYMQANAAWEKDRIFCRHDMCHVLDVARIAYILDLEEAYAIKKEYVYTAALLHDIGRHVQYETGRKHGPAGAELAKEILTACGYESAEQAMILEAIACHSDKSLIEERSLKGLLARADILSRACYQCPAASMCNWEEGRRNQLFPEI